jgi:NAD+ synthase (glutamine-hydrolysing)
MKIALVQMNPIIGDLVYNKERILGYCEKAQNDMADLVIFPELCLTGYPPKDLLLRKDFLQAQENALTQIAKATTINVLLGAAILFENSPRPYNAAVLCGQHDWHLVAKKTLLPNYNVFDEKRYFIENETGKCSIININNKKILISICEDAWASLPGMSEIEYNFDPIERALCKESVDLILNIAASPFSLQKPRKRNEIFTRLAKNYNTPVLMVGQVGANDQLMFDGNSVIINKQGDIILKAKPCVEQMIWFDENQYSRAVIDKDRNHDLDDEMLLIEVISMGIRDYVEKCGAIGTIIGVSGGIDSALCAALSVRALGPERVRLVFLPSHFTSTQSFHDAKKLAENLLAKLDVMPIETCLNILRQVIWDESISLNKNNADILDQNLQSRLRGLLIMAMSNASDHMMVATSNKSELAVGYATIYGDLCGAFSPLGDVYKTQVYKLAYRINQEANKEIIPLSIINRPPTAELKPHQLDTESLPEYAILDKILFNFIDLEKSVSEMVSELAIDRQLLESIIAMVSRSEYKRRQSPMPFMVSEKVFGDARRLPIAKRMRLI